jgi:serine protease
VRDAQEVDFVEAAQMMHVEACSQQNGAEWGLNRVAQRKMELHGQFRYDSKAGEGVDAYIIDTGIRATHQDFGTRAKMIANFVNDGQFTDCNGHGTHVAGTVGGTAYGVAKKVTLYGVKVLGCNGSGSNSGVIAGIDLSADEAQVSGRPSVINMSLGGSLSTATNAAVDAASNSGVTVVVAAGNSNADACNYSPASAKQVLSVGATTVASKGGVQEDARSTFSNYGSCVHIFAPGQNIKSTWIDDNTDVNTISGTSMASPHVCGLAALYISYSGKSKPADVKAQLINDATTSEIDLLCVNSACNKSPNRMAFVGCE